jgi:hypothetical protein
VPPAIDRLRSAPILFISGADVVSQIPDLVVDDRTASSAGYQAAGAPVAYPSVQDVNP